MIKVPGIRALFAAVFASLMLTSCGGDCLQIGGCDRGGDSALLSLGANASASTLEASHCNIAVGPNSIAGTVTKVTDGDTITVSSNGKVETIRLEGIDAPEIEQTYGPESSRALAALVLNRPVTVTYTDTDRYGRIVGGVFTSTCDYVNLTQLRTGMAWFYAAYQCDLSEPARSDFKAAQDAAMQAGVGLWSQPNQVAPWVFRNGNDPEVPQCSGDSGTSVQTPSNSGNEALGDGGASIPATPNPVSEALGTSCGPKTTCSQMSSCSEATYYLKQCNVRSLDGDGDGVPCESICRQ